MEDQAEISDYPTCQQCFATLYIDTGELDPDFVTERLNLDPTSIQRKGERWRQNSKRINPLSGWALSSEGAVTSRDLRNHLDWIFEKIALRKAVIDSLRSSGCVFQISCYWLSAAGHGGPVFSIPQVKALAAFEFEIWLDIYFLAEAS